MAQRMHAALLVPAWTLQNSLLYSATANVRYSDRRLDDRGVTPNWSVCVPLPKPLHCRCAATGPGLGPARLPRRRRCVKDACPGHVWLDLHVARNYPPHISGSNTAVHVNWVPSGDLAHETTRECWEGLRTAVPSTGPLCGLSCVVSGAFVLRWPLSVRKGPQIWRA